MYTMDDIVREGHPILRQVADAVTLPPSEEDQKTLNKMMEYLVNSQDDNIAQQCQLRPGIGLAAPQIAVSKRMLAVYLVDGKEQLHQYAMINPRIISHSIEKSYLESGEGCLSVDRDVPGYVPRYARIKVRAYDINGQEFTIKLRGLPSIAVQHELDHLDGIMFYDHINADDPFAVPDNARSVDR
ncbi:peptide deformylase [Tuberibacillus sp. Marseille-P3662]|uniref:peptide deformylase n=1 Tax=Tuberibacillus sp. Marseille-P3662 TaxID=1965358 RepID=UPI000A1C8265|nr:peptide deformylase [Tuberibacillus sp. Marseille-P3662]